MARTLVIKPIDIKYDESGLKTLQSSLSKYGYSRAPGTAQVLSPARDVSGKVRTGLDPKAPYVLRMGEEAKSAELELIKTLTEELQSQIPGVDLSPSSEIWNIFSDQEIGAKGVKLGNDPVVIIADDVNGLINYCWIRVHPQLAKSLESFYNHECPDCRYYLENKEAEQRLEFSRKQEINSTFRKWEDLTPSRRKDISILMGLPVTEHSKEEHVYNLMDSHLREGKYNEGEYKGRSTVKLLKEFLELTPEHVEVKRLINDAIRYNIYRSYDGRIEEGSLTIAKSKDELTNVLLDPKNQKQRLALESKIQAKKESLA